MRISRGGGHRRHRRPTAARPRRRASRAASPAGPAAAGAVVAAATRAAAPASSSTRADGLPSERERGHPGDFHRPAREIAPLARAPPPACRSPPVRARCAARRRAARCSRAGAAGQSAARPSPITTTSKRWPGMTCGLEEASSQSAARAAGALRASAAASSSERGKGGLRHGMRLSGSEGNTSGAAPRRTAPGTRRARPLARGRTGRRRAAPPADIRPRRCATPWRPPPRARSC